MDATLPTTDLRMARENAGLNQATLAAQVGWSASALSRLEKANTTDRAMAHRYLEGIGTEESTAIRDFYNVPWRITERPSFYHPDRLTLSEIEHALQALDTFEHDPSFDPILTRPVHILRSRLLTSYQFLQRLDHSIPHLGSIAVGKTTALARVTNLMLPDASGQLQSIFPVGKGRTTVCEVKVKVAPAFGLVVESFCDDDVRTLVSDLVSGLQKSGPGVSTELDRVIRSMADLHQRRAVENGKRYYVDPIEELLHSGNTSEDVISTIMLRINLSSRTQNQIILSERNENGLQWIAKNVGDINFGQHPDFSIPERITVLTPSKLLRASPYEISIIDTKGVEGTTTQRADLQARIDDPRALSVICCRFEDAPGAAPLALLRNIQKLGSDAIERGRVCLLVLPRGDEAVGVRGDGELSSDRDDGYFIREDHILKALHNDGLPEFPILFFDAMRDNPLDLWNEFNRLLAGIRGGYAERARRLNEAAATLIDNADAARSLEARIQVAEAIDRLDASYGILPPVSRPAHQDLVEQVREGHASSIAASMNRRGAWMNFSIHHMLGAGVRADANARTSDLFVRIDAQLVDLEQKFYQLTVVCQLLASLRDELNDRRQDFLAQALTVGSGAFKAYLDDADDLWRTCVGRWGMGSGYRGDVAAIVQRWFEESAELGEARRSVDKSLQQAWRDVVLGSLIAASRVDLDEEPGLDAA